MAYVSFDEVKKAVSIEKAAELLGLKLKPGNNQSRGPCPVCLNAGERAMVITPGKGWYCWGAKKGGDVISLASHVLNKPPKEAAEFLAGDSARTVPRSEKAQDAERSNHAQSFKALDYLEPENEAVEALGFSTEFAKSFGIGFAPKGVMRGSVAIPLRDEHGTLLGYIATQELTYIAPGFTPNVIDLNKRRA